MTSVAAQSRYSRCPAATVAPLAGGHLDSPGRPVQNLTATALAALEPQVQWTIYFRL